MKNELVNGILENRNLENAIMTENVGHFKYLKFLYACLKLYTYPNCCGYYFMIEIENSSVLFVSWMTVLTWNKSQINIPTLSSVHQLCQVS